MVETLAKMRESSPGSVLTIAVLAVAALAAALSPVDAGAQSAGSFPELTPGQRVYDATGTSLSSTEIMDLEQRLQDLEAVGANAVVFVRALDATPEETLEQVEALQQAWVAETGADQDTAVAILINRNPDDQTDARAGIFVGSTFDDGNVPRDEQVAIVEEELIPPLRDGDVYASLTAGIDRLESSIVSGPPRSAFERWASDAGASWLPWVGVGAALAGLAAAVALFRRRETIDRPDQAPTTSRPSEDLSPALAGALVAGGPQASAVPATILDLATRDALDVEPESEGGTFSKPKVRVRLLDRELVRGDIEATLWHELEKRADGGIVASKDLQKAASDSSAVRDAVKRQLFANDWLDPRSGRAKIPILLISIGTFLLAVFGLVVAAVGEQWLPVIGVIALALVAVAAIAMYSMYSNLTRRGQEAAIPWKAYRDGIQEAAKDDTLTLDLDAVLADAIAMNLGSKLKNRLKQANESREPLRAFTTQTGLRDASYQATAFPWWIAFSSTVTTSSGGAGTGTVSGAGAGGGGGAAGST